MKRGQVYFVAFVWGLVAFGVLVVHTGKEDPELGFPRTVPIEVELPPVVVPRGETTLAGVVTESDGRPAVNCMVSLFRPELDPGTAPPLHWTFTDDAGRFAFADLGHGAYQAVLLQPTSPPTSMAVEVPTETEVAWTLNPPNTELEVLPELLRTGVAGRLLRPPGFTAARFPLDSYEVVLVPAEDTHPLSGAVQRRSRTDEIGNFRFERVARADYKLRVIPRWARGGSWPVLAEVDVPLRRSDGGGSGQALEVQLAFGTLLGKAFDDDGNPIEGALVVIRPEPAEANRFWPPRDTDASGTFTVLDLPPGRYRVRVRAGANAKEEIVTISAGQDQRIEIGPLVTKAGTLGDDR